MKYSIGWIFVLMITWPLAIWHITGMAPGRSIDIAWPTSSLAVGIKPLQHTSLWTNRLPKRRAKGQLGWPKKNANKAARSAATEEIQPRISQRGLPQPKLDNLGLAQRRRDRGEKKKGGFSASSAPLREDLAA